jgi:hypothetical protein
MTILDDGNVGIGTTNPIEKLSINSGVARTSTAKTYTSFIHSNDTDDYRFGLVTALKGGASTSDRYVSMDASTYQISTNTYAGQIDLALQSLGGSVGIGTSSPDTILDINGRVVYPSVKLQASNLTGRFMTLGMDSSVDMAISAQGSSTNLVFKTVNTERMRIDSAGKVGIGTTNPSSKLDVDGIITATGGNSTEWNTAYSNQGNYLPLAGGTLTGTLTGTSSNFYNVTTDILKVNWKHYDGSNSPGTSGQVLSSTGSSTKWITLSGISGSGTTNYIPKFTAAGAIGNSQIIDTGIYVGINQASPNHMLDVTGEINVTGEYFLNGEGIIASGTHKIYVGDWDGNGFDTTILGSNGSQTLTVRGTSVGINETAPTSKLHVNGILEYQNNDGALDAGLTAGAFYRTGDLLKVVH